MHPVLFEIPVFGGITINTYGFFVATGFVAGIIWISYETKRNGLNTASAIDLVFYILVSAIIGSRILFLIVNEPARLFTAPWSMFMVWEGGLVFFGGLIAAVIVGIFYIRWKDLPFLPYADVFGPAIALGHFFGRIGCFMAGCCHGAPSKIAWLSVTFPPNPRSFAPSGVPLYPTQLMEALGNLLIFLGLAWMTRRKKFEGQVFGLYLFSYSIMRFFVEMLRGDADRGYVIPGVISTAQFVSIVLFAGSLVFLAWARRRSKYES